MPDILFLMSLADSPEQIYKRVSLKFPKDINKDSLIFNENIEANSIISFYKRILRQTGDRQWKRFVLK